ncbi:hypothetical protein [Flavobacterium cerinum]|uniref:Uncharacterized protein n=1 Tax=Flavobacterium cerinum TaxID=2502784 RepID=A0A444HDD1_9FLAO|nr:hypothetical protein [Flavobacterium cerinum]RWX02279.1 hypothetical protein EPI11_03415 [Flavobacterium cerinum]
MEIPLDKSYDLYIDTINDCGIFLLNKSDEEIEYRIFEEFIIGAHSFLYRGNLEKLNLAGYITKEVMDKSIILRDKVLLLDNTDEWNIFSVRTSKSWRDIMILADEIKDKISKS